MPENDVRTSAEVSRSCASDPIVQPSRARGRRFPVVAVAALLMGTFWTVIAAYAVHAAMPPNAVRLPLEDKLRMRDVLPQGWAFFTRDPQEPAIIPHVRSKGRFVAVDKGPNANKHNWFGIRRLARAQNVEVGILMSKVPMAFWDRCRSAPVVCLEKAGLARTLSNPFPRPTVCGEVGLVRQESIPWAWTRDDTVPMMPSKIVRLEVRC